MPEHLPEVIQAEGGLSEETVLMVGGINVCRMNKICTHPLPPVFSNSPKRGDFRGNLESYNKIRKLHFFVHLGVYNVSEYPTFLHSIKIRREMRMDCNKLLSV